MQYVVAILSIIVVILRVFLVVSGFVGTPAPQQAPISQPVPPTYTITIDLHSELSESEFRQLSEEDRVTHLLYLLRKKTDKETFFLVLCLRANAEYTGLSLEKLGTSEAELSHFEHESNKFHALTELKELRSIPEYYSICISHLQWWCKEDVTLEEIGTTVEELQTLKKASERKSALTLLRKLRERDEENLPCSLLGIELMEKIEEGIDPADIDTTDAEVSSYYPVLNLGYPPTPREYLHESVYYRTFIR